MKNFSLKALGAIIFAAGLVVAGVAAPAAAVAGVTMVTSPTPTFDANAQSAAFEVAIDNGSNAFSSDGSPDAIQITIDVRGTGSNFGMWFPKSGCASTFTAFATANCGIISIAGTGITSPVVKQSAGQLFIKGLGTATTINIQFALGAFQTGADGGTYNFKASTGPGGNPTNYTLPLTVNPPAPPASSAVTFDANGGSGTMASQTSAFSTTLTPVGFTKSGTTFSGWATSCNGAVVYGNRALYTFSSSITLFAKWADGSNSCGGSSGGNTAASANLTLNASTGQLVAGSTVAVVASGLQTTALYTVIVESTPQTLSPVNARATAGAVNTSVTLPSNLEAGWHTLTFSSTASTGSAVESKSYFKVSASGTLLATSTTIPAELANTGVDSTSAILLLAGGLSLALVGAEMFMIARRKRSN